MSWPPCLTVLPAPPARPFASRFDGNRRTMPGAPRRPPPRGLRRHCGRPLHDLLDAARGTLPKIHERYESAATFEARLEPSNRIANGVVLMAGAEHPIQQSHVGLCGRLLATGHVVHRVEYDRGREWINLLTTSQRLSTPRFHLVGPFG